MKVKHVNLCFGNYPLAILEIREDYDSIAAALLDIVSEVKSLLSVEINGHTHLVEYFLGGDMKILALACGIEAANAKYSCIWCKCPSIDRWDMTKDWSAFSGEKGARTIAD